MRIIRKKDDCQHLPFGCELALYFESFLLDLQDEVLAHIHLVPAGAFCFLQVHQEFRDVPRGVMFRVKGGMVGRLHLFELMPGMVIVVEHIEEALLQMDLPGDEVFTTVQTGADLLLDLIRRKLFFVGEDRLAVLFVIAGIAVHIGEADVRADCHDAPCLPPPSPAP